MKNCELSASFPKDLLELAYRATSPNANELGLAARVTQQHLASEKKVELVQSDISLHKDPITVNMTPYASR
jgi:hypothetical protein